MRKHLAWLLVLLLAVPTLTSATGSLTIPNTLANLAAGAQPLSVIDTNFSTIATYVNAREITAGVCASRPAASVSGRFYLCTDTAGGTLYFDTGSTWTQVAGGVNPSATMPGSRGLVAGTASLTVVNASATQINLRSPSDGSVVIQTTAATATLSNNVIATSPAVNARDQTAQFSASSWIHFYYIWNGTTLGTLSSACSPSDVNGACSSSFGPNLPSSYTHLAYIGAWRYNGSSNLLLAHARGPWVTYEARQSALAAGTATVETAISLTALIPPGALNVNVWGELNVNTGGGAAGGGTLQFRHTSGSTYVILSQGVTTTANQQDTASFIVPNRAQNLYYLTTVSGGGNTISANAWVIGYQVQNGSD